MSDSIGAQTEKLGRIIGDLLRKQSQITEAKKALKEAVKSSEDGELKERVKELKGTRKTITAEIKDLQTQLDNQTLANNPDIKSLREKVLEIEEEEADLKVSVRELSGPLLEKNPIIEITVPGESDLPIKVQLMRSVIANINGREQNF